MHEEKMLLTLVLCVLLANIVVGDLTRSLRNNMEFFTHLNGEIADDITNTLSLSDEGPITLFDRNFHEQISHFNREKILPRRVALVGTGAFGYFECKNSELWKLTKASLFSQAGKKTRVTTRFGTGSTARDIEASRFLFLWSTRFYTDEGNLDLLMLSHRAFPLRDPMRFSDAVHTIASIFNPTHYVRQAGEPTLGSQSLLSIFLISLDTNLPDGWRPMNASSPVTHKLINSKGEIHYARFNVKSLTPLGYLDDDDASWARGHYPDYNSRDLVQSIKRGDYPKWLLRAQIMTPEESEELEFNPFDVTKIWDEKRFPSITFGEVTLNRTYSDFFAQNELAAFDPNNLVPGIDITLDRNLQGRLYAYKDAQNYRLGINYQEFSINRPEVPVNAPTIRDSICADPEKEKSGPNYFPNSYGKTKLFGNNEVPIKLPEVELKRWDVSGDENYAHLNMTWTQLSEGEQSRALKRLSFLLINAPTLFQRFYLSEMEKVNNELHDRLESTMALVKVGLANGRNCTCNKKFLRRFDLDYVRRK